WTDPTSTPPKLAYASEKRGDPSTHGPRLPQTQKPDGWRLPDLRCTRRNWPHSRTAEKCNELAPPHRYPRGLRHGIIVAQARPQKGGRQYEVCLQCPLWFISGHFAVQSPCSLYPQKRTFERQIKLLLGYLIGLRNLSYTAFVEAKRSIMTA